MKKKAIKVSIKLLIMFLTLIAFTKCDQSKQFIHENQIKGLWIYENAYLDIGDSMVNYMLMYPFQRYTYSQNVLSFNKFDIYEHKEKIDNYNFKVEILSNNSLLLEDLQDGNKYHYIRAESLFFKPYNVEEIYFKSSICDGVCPSMELTLKRNGQYYFNGIFNTIVLGKIENKVESVIIQKIFDNVKYIDLDNLIKSKNDSLSFIGQTYYLQIKGIDETWEFSIDTNSSPQLKNLINYLMEFYKIP